ncbi:unnamed protein product, partial [Rotaria sp. Silwood1]
MDNDKQTLTFNQPLKDETIKLQNDRSITRIEHLSTELFVTIFGYLNCYDIYEAFSNLNYRFQRLLNSSFYFYEIDLNQFVPTRNKLTALPCLFFLSIIIDDTDENVGEIYQLILVLPKLKSISLTINSIDSQINLLTYTKKRQSTIEYLSINSRITIGQIFDILAYTPQIHHMHVRQTEMYSRRIHLESPIKLTNLTHISIHKFDGNLNQFETFLSQIYCKLKYLHITLT